MARPEHPSGAQMFGMRDYGDSLVGNIRVDSADEAYLISGWLHDWAEWRRHRDERNAKKRKGKNNDANQSKEDTMPATLEDSMHKCCNEQIIDLKQSVTDKMRALVGKTKSLDHALAEIERARTALADSRAEVGRLREARAMTIRVKVILNPRKQRRCEMCHGRIEGPAVRWYGAAEEGDPAYTIYTCVPCAAESADPKVVKALEIAGFAVPAPEASPRPNE